MWLLLKIPLSFPNVWRHPVDISPHLKNEEWLIQRYDKIHDFFNNICSYYNLHYQMSGGIHFKLEGTINSIRNSFLDEIVLTASKLKIEFDPAIQITHCLRSWHVLELCPMRSMFLFSPMFSKFFLVLWYILRLMVHAHRNRKSTFNFQFKVFIFRAL